MKVKDMQKLTGQLLAAMQVNFYELYTTYPVNIFATLNNLNLKMQWKSTSAVLHWFNNLTTTNRHSFIVFDIVDFYPSISSKLLSDALDFDNLHTIVSNYERNIILHTKKSILVHDNLFWGKRQSDNLFDVTMGSHDGAETCELIGLFLLSTILKKFRANIGVYRDDGLRVTDLKPQLAERLKKDLCTLFQSHGLNITIDVNIKTTDYLDVTLDLVKKHHTPYSKPNNIPLYVHKESNHPPSILKNIPESINRRLCDIFTNETIFNNAIPQYQDALAKVDMITNSNTETTLTTPIQASNPYDKDGSSGTTHLIAVM